MDPTRLYKKGMKELLSQDIPKKAAEKRQLISDLNSMMTHVIILNAPVKEGQRACPKKEADIARLKKRITEIETTLPKRSTQAKGSVCSFPN